MILPSEDYLCAACGGRPNARCSCHTEESLCDKIHENTDLPRHHQFVLPSWTGKCPHGRDDRWGGLASCDYCRDAVVAEIERLRGERDEALDQLVDRFCDDSTSPRVTPQVQHTRTQRFLERFKKVKGKRKTEWARAGQRESG